MARSGELVHCGQNPYIMSERFVPGCQSRIRHNSVDMRDILMNENETFDADGFQLGLSCACYDAQDSYIAPGTDMSGRLDPFGVAMPANES